VAHLCRKVLAQCCRKTVAHLHVKIDNYPVIPAKCPICHAKVTFDVKLSSRYRGAGWRCEVGGSAHYWQRMGQASALKSAQKRAIQQGLPPPEPLPADGW